MTEKDPQHDDADKAPIEVSFLGPKIKANSSASGYTSPKSFSELGRRYKRHVLALLEFPGALVVAVASTAVNIASGIGGVFVRPPKAEFEDTAEQLEAATRETTVIKEPPPLDSNAVPGVTSPSEAATDQASEILQEFRDRGLAVEIRDLGKGRLGFYIVPPEELEATIELVENKALQRLDIEETLDKSSTVLDRPCAELDLSLRTLGALQKLGVQTIRQLIGLTSNDLMAIQGFGEASLDEIRGQLMFLGLSLVDDSPPLIE